MSAYIPKDRQANVRPWKLTSLDGGRARGEAAQDAERVAAINRKAYREGYDAGYAAGARAAQVEAERLAALVAGAHGELAALDQRITSELVALALSLARAFTREALRVKPEIVEAVVRDAVRSLPLFNQSVRLRVNPADAPLIAAHLGGELEGGWTIVEDPTVERGGCRVESSGGDVDATVETRWAHLAAALAQEPGWLE